ncbi:MAG: hypothetical protein N3A55_04495 [Methylohalobius sp.]|nr:hypothetical protein [Methylohalobius sp.]
MKTKLIKIGRALRQRLSLKVLVGGPLGAFAWSLWGAGALAVLIWGLKTVAIPLLILKTTSWGLWGAGVLRQFNLRRQTMDADERDANGDQNI